MDVRGAASFRCDVPPVGSELSRWRISFVAHHHSSMFGIVGDGCLAGPLLARFFNPHSVESVGCVEPYFVGVHRNGAQRLSHFRVEISSISGLVHFDDLVPLQSKIDHVGWVLSSPCRPLLGHD